MRGKAICLFTLAALLGGPTGVWACDSWLNNRFIGTMFDGIKISVGDQLQPGEDDGDTFNIFFGDVGIPIAEGKAVLAPALGYCKGGDFGEIMFGGAAAVNIFNNDGGTFALNLQTQVSRVSYEGGSELYFPVALAGAVNAGESFDFTFGGGFRGVRDSFDSEGGDDSETDFDPYAFAGGIIEASEMLSFQATLGLVKGDHDTDLNFNFGVSITPGS